MDISIVSDGALLGSAVTWTIITLCTFIGGAFSFETLLCSSENVRDKIRAYCVGGGIALLILLAILTFHGVIMLSF